MEKIGDLDAVTAQWRNNTQWDPTNANGGPGLASIRVDGVRPCGAWAADEIAISCKVWIVRFDGTNIDFYDIEDVDVGIHLTLTWNYGADVPAAGSMDFRGIATHEIGHGIRLVDLHSCAAPPFTMCGDVPVPGQGDYTFQLRSIESDDISGANLVY